MPGKDALDLGRDAFARRDWATAYTKLVAADGVSPLSPVDLEQLAVTARMLGKSAECAELWARAHQDSLRAGNVEHAVRCAFWLAFGLMDAGEFAQGSGWLSRAQRLLEEHGVDSVEQGYLMMPLAIGAMDEDPESSLEMFTRVAEIATRFDDLTLATMARMGRGRSLIRLGRAAEGVPLLDDVMVAATADEPHPMVVGDLYCGVIEACWEISDVARAQEWTKVLSAWCDSQPDLIQFRGQCRVHRAQLLQLHGSWQEALAEAELAYALFSDPPGQPAIGLALYERAELYRLIGEFSKAEADYRLIDELGPSPYPGLAQLRLLQGRVDVAASAVRRCLAEAADRVTRCRLLPASIEILLAAGDVEGGHSASAELSDVALNFDAPFVRALAVRAAGAVSLAEGNADAALISLRDARGLWQSLDAPFEAACTRMLLGLAYRAMADKDGAQIELDAARHVFEQLGAMPFVAAVDAITGGGSLRSATGLTGRELEVLRLIAGGSSNKAIAENLVLSEKTIARHVSNIFTKLGLSNRAAATAYAYEHNLV